MSSTSLKKKKISFSYISTLEFFVALNTILTLDVLFWVITVYAHTLKYVILWLCSQYIVFIAVANLWQFWSLKKYLTPPLQGIITFAVFWACLLYRNKSQPGRDWSYILYFLTTGDDKNSFFIEPYLSTVHKFNLEWEIENR